MHLSRGRRFEPLATRYQQTCLHHWGHRRVQRGGRGGGGVELGRPLLEVSSGWRDIYSIQRSVELEWSAFRVLQEARCTRAQLQFKSRASCIFPEPGSRMPRAGVILPSCGPVLRTTDRQTAPLTTLPAARRQQAYLSMPLNLFRDRRVVPPDPLS